MAKLLLSKGNTQLWREVISPNKQTRIIKRFHTFLEKYPVAAPLGTYLATMKFITQCDDMTQIRARKTIELCISRISQKIIKKHKPSFAFTCEAISVLPRITHELRHAHQMNHPALQHLVAHMKETFYSNKSFLVEEILTKNISNLLYAIFNSQINFYRHFQFIVDLSQFYLATPHHIKPQNNLLTWKTSALVISACETSNQFRSLFEELTEKVAKENNPPESSSFHIEMASDLYKILRPNVVADIHQEYQIGGFFLDIAFPKHKLNIEADGIFYHCLGGKTYQCKYLLRDYILTHLFGWTVLRISSRDYLKNSSKMQRKECLLNKLSGFPEILSQQKTTVPKKIIAESIPRKKFPDLDELDIHSKHFNFMLKRTTETARFFKPSKKTGNQTKLVTTSVPFSQEPVIKLKKKRVRKQRTF